MQRWPALAREVTGQRAPDHRDIEPTVSDVIDDQPRRTVQRIVAVQHVAAYVVDDAASAQRMRRRRVGEIVTDHLHADRQRPQARVIESAQLHAIRRTRDEYIRRAIVRSRRRQHFQIACYSRDEIAQTGLERLANIAATLCPPYISDLRMQLARDQARELVLEALLATVRKRQIVRIRANLELARLRPQRRHRRHRKRRALIRIRCSSSRACIAAFCPAAINS